MNDHAGMRRLLLEEGLEDLIALPEAADACRYEGFIRGDDDESLHPVMQSLLDLFRAGEIKQPKRREALIENAEKARISRQLVLLDDKVDLEVPLDDLAVHEPDARKLIADGTISGGMIPKVETCIYALDQGVEGVVIMDGKVPHAVLLELLTDHGIGTLMYR